MCSRHVRWHCLQERLRQLLSRRRGREGDVGHCLCRWRLCNHRMRRVLWQRLPGLPPHGGHEGLAPDDVHGGRREDVLPEDGGGTRQKSNAPMHYVVADKSFDTESDAKLALVEATEQFVAAFAEPKVCKESGKVAIAGKELCCETAAAQTSTVAKTAMNKVEMTYLVGEKECHCPVEAAKLAKDSGDPTVYVVAGESTRCNVTARLNLARAKYKAAVVAVKQAETQATEKLTSKDS